MSATNIQRLSGYGPPCYNTIGEPNDLYQDLETGRAYRCIAIIDREEDKEQIIEYVWEKINPKYLSAEERAKLQDGFDDKAEMLTDSASGSTIAINDSVQASLSGLKVFGKSTQRSTGGSQLLPYPYINKSKTENGITFVDNGDGWISISGTSTDKTSFVFFNPIMIDVNNGDEVTISKETEGSIDCAHIAGWASDWKTFFESRPLILSSSYSVTGKINSNNIILQISIDEIGVTVNGKIRVMLNKGAEALPWEPYTGGIPAPNPQYPQPITSIGDSGEVDVEFYSGNLFDANSVLLRNNKSFNVEEGGYKITAVGGTSEYSYSYLSLPDFMAGKTVYVKYDKAIRTINTSDNTIVQLKYRTEGEMFYNDLSGTDKVTKMINIPNDATTITFAIYTNNSNTPLDTDVVSTVYGLSISLKDIPYEPYNKQSLTIPTPNGLPGIQVTDAAIANYTDSEGNMYCCDEIDLERGKYVQRVGKYKLTGLEYWNAHGDIANGSNGFYTYVDIGQSKHSGNYSMFTHFVKGWIDGEKARAFVGKDSIQVVAPTILTSIEKLKEFLQDNNCYALYILQTPIETDLSPEEIEQYKALTMNDPNTTLISEATMNVNYAVDTKSYIDKKFAELAAALV